MSYALDFPWKGDVFGLEYIQSRGQAETLLARDIIEWKRKVDKGTYMM